MVGSSVLVASNRRGLLRFWKCEDFERSCLTIASKRKVVTKEAEDRMKGRHDEQEHMEKSRKNEGLCRKTGCIKH